MTNDRLQKLLRWFLVVSGLGLLDSVWLLVLHASKGSMSSVCSMGSFVSCAALYDPRFSEWFGVPVPIFSLLYFVLLLTITGRTVQTADPHSVRPYAYLWLLSWVGLGTALWMGYISLILLKTLCPFCTVLWVILIAAWVFTRQMMKIVDQPWGYLISQDLKTGYKSVWFWGSGLIAVAVLSGSYFVFRPSGALGDARYPIVGEEARSLGPANAKVVVAEYSDFQCPFCRVASEVLHQLAEELSPQVRVVYKFFPLDRECNEYLPRRVHLNACAAAEAAYCASVQGKFWTYHDYLFTSQQELSDSRLLEIAQAAQLDVARFNACRRDRRTKEEIGKDVREGNRAGVTGTPSIYINGRPYSGPMTLSALKDTIALLPKP